MIPVSVPAESTARAMVAPPPSSVVSLFSRRCQHITGIILQCKRCCRIGILCIAGARSAVLAPHSTRDKIFLIKTYISFSQSQSRKSRAAENTAAAMTVLVCRIRVVLSTGWQASPVPAPVFRAIVLYASMFLGPKPSGSKSPAYKPGNRPRSLPESPAGNSRRTQTGPAGKHRRDWWATCFSGLPGCPQWQWPQTPALPRSLPGRAPRAQHRSSVKTKRFQCCSPYTLPLLPSSAAPTLKCEYGA